MKNTPSEGTRVSRIVLSVSIFLKKHSLEGVIFIPLIFNSVCEINSETPQMLAKTPSRINPIFWALLTNQQIKTNNPIVTVLTWSISFKI